MEIMQMKNPPFDFTFLELNPFPRHFTIPIESMKLLTSIAGIVKCLGNGFNSFYYSY